MRDIVLYTCIRCNFRTKYKSHIINHFNRKKNCPTIENDIELTEEIKKYILDNRIYNIPKTPKKPQTVIILPDRNKELIPKTNKNIKKEKTNQENNLINTLDEYEIVKEEKEQIQFIKDTSINIDKFFWDDNLISNFNNKNVIYLALIGLIDGIYIFKYGATKQVDIREFKQHKSTFEFFQMVHIEVCDNMYFVESQFQKILESKCLLKKIIINGKTQTELFTITKEHTLDKIIEIVKELVITHPLKAIQEKDIELIKLKEYYENEKIKKELETQLKEQKLISEIEKLISEIEKLKLINETQLKEQIILFELEKQKFINEKRDLENFYLKELIKIK
jgi:hypothetical protein